MAIKKGRCNELESLIGEFVKIHLKRVGAAIETENKEAMIFAMEGHIIDVTEHYLYLGGSLDDGYSVIVDLDSVYIFELMEPPSSKQKELADHIDEGMH